MSGARVRQHHTDLGLYTLVETVQPSERVQNEEKKKINKTLNERNKKKSKTQQKKKSCEQSSNAQCHC